MIAKQLGWGEPRRESLAGTVFDEHRRRSFQQHESDTWRLLRTGSEALPASILSSTTHVKRALRLARPISSLPTY